jgi:SAM-dependent methyltransferase
LGSGLGRHSIYFAHQGFDVSAIEISNYGVNYLKEWSEKENLDIDIKLGDIMVSLPYVDNSLDCVFAYHSISHTDSTGIKKLVSEIDRVLKPGGEVYTSMCSKESWDFAKAGYPKIDENTVLIKEDGPEKDVPHFFANREDILNLFNNFDIERIRHIDYCYINSKKSDSKYYYINGHKQ